LEDGLKVDFRCKFYRQNRERAVYRPTGDVQLFWSQSQDFQIYKDTNNSFSQSITTCLSYQRCTD